MASAEELPRWRGFNLVSKINVRRNRPFPAEDFRIMRDWGFDFARLPLDYRCWLRHADGRMTDEPTLAEIDDAVELGREHGIHVCINFHRAPGYTVARPPEPESVWIDEEARELCAFHWALFAERYAGIPSDELSFNLFNEPARVGDGGFTPERYRHVVQRLTAAIWEADPARLVICDGYDYGRIPVAELVDLGVAQSTRAYDPHWLTHYKAWWQKGGGEVPEPEWPGSGPEPGGPTWDADTLREHYRPWRELAEKGVGVHCGEGGVYHETPHAVALAWLEDALTVLGECGFGWALWNLRGAFGVMDSQRDDVDYEEFAGHKLDGAMLEVLRRH